MPVIDGKESAYETNWSVISAPKGVKGSVIVQGMKKI
jgi:hypothetical protein